MPEKRRIYTVNKCNRGWFTLEKIPGDSEQRYCDTCEKCVHW